MQPFTSIKHPVNLKGFHVHQILFWFVTCVFDSNCINFITTTQFFGVALSVTKLILYLKKILKF
jgi:hypothetical protein